MQYQFVQSIEGALVSSAVEPANLEAWTTIRGIEQTGVCARRNIRPELFGQPTFRTFCGPMYGGPGIARYEDNTAYGELGA